MRRGTRFMLHILRRARRRQILLPHTVEVGAEGLINSVPYFPPSTNTPPNCGSKFGCILGFFDDCTGPSPPARESPVTSAPVTEPGDAGLFALPLVFCAQANPAEIAKTVRNNVNVFMPKR